ncbi:MAG: hypothetical protein ABEH59_08455 [Halobacteriales archaeon]
MAAYRVHTPESVDEGITVECQSHGDTETFPPDHRKVAFQCSGCETEIEIVIRTAGDWRALTERC